MAPSYLPTTNLMSRLREETRVEHEALERKLDWNEICGSRDLYTRMLARFYGYVFPWERSAERVFDRAGLGHVFANRWKAPWLHDDLQFLGLNESEIESLPKVSKADNDLPLEAQLGAAYVMEGSTLGGQIISRTVSKRLGLTEGQGYSYFLSYGANVSSMWKQFGAELEYHIRDEAGQQLAIRAAGETFRHFANWLSGATA